MDPKPRRLATRLTITEGEKHSHYHLKPLPAAAGKQYQLTKLPAEGDDAQPVNYIVSLSADGATTCTCPHGAYRPHAAPCRHIAALTALGCIDPSATLEVRRLQLLWGSLVDQVERREWPKLKRGQPIVVAESGKLTSANVVRGYRDVVRIRFNSGSETKVSRRAVTPETDTVPVEL